MRRTLPVVVVLLACGPALGRPSPSSAAARGPAPIVAARREPGGWVLRLDRSPEDLSTRPFRRLAASDLPALGAAALEPTLSLYVAGQPPCELTVTGYELRPGDDMIARDGHYDETEIVATTTGCDAVARADRGWALAPSWLAARADRAALRYLAVDVSASGNLTDRGPRPRRAWKAVPRRYRFLDRGPRCARDCYPDWELRRLPLATPIEQITITHVPTEGDLGWYDAEVIGAGLFVVARSRPRPLAGGRGTLAGALVSDGRAVVLLFDDHASYRSAALDGDVVDAGRESYVHEVVGY